MSYMNASHKARVLCEGIAIYGALMDNPVRSNGPFLAKWEEWSRTHPTLADEVQRRQYDIMTWCINQ